MKFDKEGRECPDSTPVMVPVGFRRPENLTDQIRRMVRNELSVAASSRAMETFREANDFEVGDEDRDGFLTPYEVQGMQEEIPHEEVRDAAAGRKGNGGDDDKGADAEKRGSVERFGEAAGSTPAAAKGSVSEAPDGGAGKGGK